MIGEFPHTRTVFQQGISEGWHPGAQLYIWRRGQVLADLGLGESRPDVPMTPDSVVLWMSSVKPVAAVAIAQLWERGLLDPDDRICTHIPEFCARGKDDITIRHILTHTGGFRVVTGVQWNDAFEDVVAKVCEAAQEPRWQPGRMAGYHPNGAWYILAELVRRLDGRSFDKYVREAIFLPLGMHDSWIGMPREVYHTYGRRIAFICDTSNGQLKSAGHGNSEEEAAAVRPSGNGRGPIRELGRFYQMLLHKGGLPDGRRLLMPQTVDALVSRHRAGMNDLTFKHVMDWGLGFIINSDHYGPDTVPYGFGGHASPRAFGHSGHQSSCAFCDPDQELIVAWYCGGMPGEQRHNVRQRAINRAIYRDLGLDGA